MRTVLGKNIGVRKDRSRRSRDRKRIHLVIDQMKNAPCLDCGGYFAPAVMEYDHVPGRGGKSFNISKANKSLRATLAEIEKCDLVCANCHRIRTEKRRAESVAAELERKRRISALALEVQRERESGK